MSKWWYVLSIVRTKTVATNDNGSSNATLYKIDCSELIFTIFWVLIPFIYLLIVIILIKKQVVFNFKLSLSEHHTLQIMYPTIIRFNFEFLFTDRMQELSQRAASWATSHALPTCRLQQRCFDDEDGCAYYPHVTTYHMTVP